MAHLSFPILYYLHEYSGGLKGGGHVKHIHEQTADPSSLLIQSFFMRPSIYL